MPMTSELETLHAKGGHCGNGHLTSRGIAALHRLYIHTLTFTQSDKQTEFTHDVQFTESSKRSYMTLTGDCKALMMAWRIHRKDQMKSRYLMCVIGIQCFFKSQDISTSAASVFSHQIKSQENKTRDARY